MRSMGFVKFELACSLTIISLAGLVACSVEICSGICFEICSNIRSETGPEVRSEIRNQIPSEIRSKNRSKIVPLPMILNWEGIFLFRQKKSGMQMMRTGRMKKVMFFKIFKHFFFSFQKIKKRNPGKKKTELSFVKYIKADATPASIYLFLTMKYKLKIEKVVNGTSTYRSVLKLTTIGTVAMINAENHPPSSFPVNSFAKMDVIHIKTMRNII